MRTFRRRLTGLLAAVLLVGILVGLPVILVEVGGNPLPDRLPSLSDLGKALTSPDDGTLALAAISLIAWAAWLILAGSILIEATSRLRGITAPALPGLRLPQLAARNLVAAALLLFAAASLPIQDPREAAAQPVACPPGHSHGPADAQHRPRDTHTPAAAGNRGEVGSATVAYRVRSGDSLWTIARDHLGSGARYTEIAELNSKILRGRPGFITPGTILRLPASTRTDPDPAAHTMTVKRGDTLSEIAEEELGDADRYPEIFRASKTITQPENRHLTDPDVIDVGWTLKIPGSEPRKDTGKRTKPGNGHRTPQNDQRRRHAERPTPESTAKALPTAPRSATPASRPTESATQLPTPRSSADGVDDPAQPDADLPPWLLTGLTGGGVVLAASLLLLLRTRRRSQFRNRRPGRTIAVPGPHLTPVEKSISAVGDFSAPMITVVDAALRRLAASQAAAQQAMPPLTAIQLSSGTIRLHLSRPFGLPDPWQNTDDRCCWTVPLTVDINELGPHVADQPAPYPLLITIGSDDDNGVWLLNWEELAVVNITGDPTYRADFARYLAAEVACNPWSEAVTVDCVGVADEVAALNPDRVRTHPPGTDPAEELIADAVATLGRDDEVERGVATARAQQAGADGWPARLLLIGVTDPPPTSLDQLISVVQEHHGRTGTAVATIGHHTNPGGLVVDLTPQGRLRVPSLGLDLVAVGLTADEALGCAALLAQSTSGAPDVAVPEQIDADGWHAYADEAGALRTEHTHSRGTPADPVANPATSVLPRDDDDYLRAAAATAQDLATLAPEVPVGLRQAIEGADPTLDADLNAWFADDCDLPRLALLGPVGARTHGIAIAKRKPYYTELLSYLATRPHGATPEEVADAFSITGPRVRNDIKVLRDWLGVNPRTGRKHLPDARDSAAARARGVGVYQVENLLVDADLFRRLRVRGESRGADGIDDLRQALQLVTGQPFDKLRRGGWTWLYEGDRLDHHLVCGIVDVAHLVTTHALAEGDLNTARTATQIATSAAPYEEILRLDLAAIAAAAGHRQEAARIVRDEVCNRSDDGHPPLELSERTEQILAAHDWLPPMKSAS
jgi:nucleoid-associated protein YgaU